MSDDVKQRILARRAQLVAAALSSAVGGAALASCEPTIRPAQTVEIGPGADASVAPIVLASPDAGSPVVHAAPDAGSDPLIATVASEPDAGGPAPVPCLSPVPCLKPTVVPRPCLSPPRPCLKPTICLSMDAP